MSFYKYMAAGALAAFSATAVAAAPVEFDVEDNNSIFADEIVMDGGTYSNTLGIGDSLSVTVDGNQDVDKMGVIGFTIDPVPAASTYALSFNFFDNLGFGDTTVHFSTTADASGSFASDTVSGSGDEIVITTELTSSPIFLVFEWEGSGAGSFTGDFSIAAVPLPAAGFLMLAGLGGLGLMRRRKDV